MRNEICIETKLYWGWQLAKKGRWIFILINCQEGHLCLGRGAFSIPVVSCEDIVSREGNEAPCRDRRPTPLEAAPSSCGLYAAGVITGWNGSNCVIDFPLFNGLFSQHTPSWEATTSHTHVVRGPWETVHFQHGFSVCYLAGRETQKKRSDSLG